METLRPRISNPLFNLLKTRNFQYLWWNGSISSSGDTSELLVMGWLVYQLTGSPWDVALVGLSHTVAMFSFTLIAGAIGDRRDRRHIIMAATATNVLIVGGVLLMMALGNIEPLHLFIAAAIRGASRSFDNTSRRALIFHVVGPSNLVQAISLEQIGFSMGRIVGPLAIGLLLQLTGTAISVYSLLTALYVISFISIFLVKVPPVVSPLPRGPVLKSIGEGVKYAYSSPPIAGVLTASIVMNALFQYHLFIPVIAAEHLHVGEGLMGLLAASDGIGFVIGSLLIGLLGTRIKIQGNIFLAGCLGVTLFLLGFALSPWLFLSFFLLIGMGICQAGFSTMQSGILLMTSPPRFHSRIFGAQGMAIGTGQMGNMEIGALAAAFGISLALVGNALVGMGLIVLIAVFMPAMRRPIVRKEDPADVAPQPPPAPPEKPPRRGIFSKDPQSTSSGSGESSRQTPARKRSSIRMRLRDLSKNRVAKNTPDDKPQPPPQAKEPE